MSIVSVGLQACVALVVIDHPPDNAGSAGQRAALGDALAQVAAEPGIEGVVITGAGRHFYAGSELREFDGELGAPQLPDLVERIEELQVPVVAAIRGIALGGGLELALACDARIVDSSARLGFPEVIFGIVPRAGGSVPVSRLLGVPGAIDLVTSARQVEAAEAHSLGLVDAVVPAAELVAQARSHSRGDGKKPLRDAPVPPAETADIEAALAPLPRRARPTAWRVAQLIVQPAELEVGAALAAERALFNKLCSGEEAQKLRYLFFARRSAARALRGTGESRQVRSVGIVRGGNDGRRAGTRVRHGGICRSGGRGRGRHRPASRGELRAAVGSVLDQVVPGRPV